MKQPWKLLPIVAAAALGLAALMPGLVSADVGDVDVVADTVNSGSTVNVNINADQTGDITIHVSGVSGTSTVSFEVADCDGCNDENDVHTGTADFTISDDGFPSNGDITLALTMTCSADDNISVTATQGASDSDSVQCIANTTPTVTPTVTGTPPTTTPTATTTPTGDTITLSAVQPNPACGQAVFLFATVKNQAGQFVAGANVTFTSSGGGSFSPTSATTVTDGVASSTFTPPTSGTSTITITATTNGKTSTASVPVNCGNATSTPVPAAPTATPGTSVVRPPSTGDAGLASDNDNTALYLGVATLIGTVFAGAVVVARRRA
jgi:hypothetical protein